MNGTERNEQRVVSIFGGYEPGPGEADFDVAGQVGGMLAELGYAVANGGYAGTMEASAGGARRAGGHTIGVVCNLWSREPNKHIVEVVRTKTYEERLRMLIDLGTGGYVALPGATGTLVELAMVWEYACKGFLTPVRPIVCMGAFWGPLVEMMTRARAKAGQFVHLLDDLHRLPEVFPPVAR